MTWQPLSKRMAGTQPDGPYEGVPRHLMSGVLHWFRGLCRSGSNGRLDEARLRQHIARIRYEVNIDDHGEEILEALTLRCSADEEFCVDVLDAALKVWGRDWNRWRALDAMLSAGGSVWAIADDHESLKRVVSDEMQAALDAATSVADEATTELQEAWTNAFGRNGDPSDAWDHAIKAMEALFIPLVIPKKAKPNLGGVIGELRNQGHVWKFVLPGKDQNNDVAPLVGMLDGIWPNVDRHGGSGTSRPPTPEEARAVVTLASTIVQWHREGWIVQRR